MTGIQSTEELKFVAVQSSKLEKTPATTIATTSTSKTKWFRIISQYLADFNLFPSTPPSTDQDELQTQRLSTRIYIVLFVLSLTILLAYASAIKVSKMVIVQTPGFSEYKTLYSQYQRVLSCPCQDISINYATFLSINYTFHQLCTSFYVTDEWVSMIIRMPGVENLNKKDFRFTSIQTFQALRSFCELSNQTVSTNLLQFYATSYVSAVVTPEDLFQSQSETLIKQFISSTYGGFLISLNLIRDTTQANALLAGHQSNYWLHRNSKTRYLDATTMTYDHGCTCAYSSSCVTSSMIFDSGASPSEWSVPGFYTGCLASEAVSRSNLQCLFNDTCLSELKLRMGLNAVTGATVLNSSVSSSFQPSTRIGVILEQSMVEKWNSSATYELYYERCKPLKCSYTISARNNAINIITIVISLMGGLATALKLSVYRVVWLIKYRLRSKKAQNVRQKNPALLRRLLQYLRDINLFPSIPPSIDKDELRIQRVSTRMFIMSLLLSLTILLVYTSAVKVTKTVTIQNPDFDQYNKLYEQYQQTLSCTCKEISINHVSFLRVNYTFHQICKSYFITDDWLLLFLNITYNEVPYLGDFLLTATQTFQAIKAFCDLSNQSMSTNLLQFYAKNYISAFVTPAELFQLQSETFIQQFISSTTNNFALFLNVIRQTTQVNALLSALGTNYALSVSSGSIHLTKNARSYNGSCSCRLNSLCSQYSAIHKNTSASSGWIVPGFYTGCYLLEGLLQSSLECLYNQTCLTELQSKIPLNVSLNITPLDSSLDSRFSKNAKFETMLNEMIVDQSKWSIDYHAYYTACKPSECIYTYTTKNDAIYIITTLIGLIGGLVTALKFIIPSLVMFLTIRFNRQMRIKAQSVRQRSSASPKRFIQYLRDINLFSSIPPSTDQDELRIQRASTRMFIVSLILSLTILLVYTSAVKVTKTVTIQNPDFDQYNKLYEQYQQTISCPCRQISISYKNFINIKYSFHQVCSSYYVTDEWIAYFIASNVGSVYLSDYRITGRQIFQGLRSMCELVEQTISSSLAQFNATNYASAFVTPADLLQSQAKTFIQQFISLTTNSFALSLKMARDTTQANGLASALSTNYEYIVNFGSTNLELFWQDFAGGCTCAYATGCTTVSYIYKNESFSSWWLVPKFVTTCFTLDSLRQCSLECFFDESCLTTLQSQMGPTLPMVAPVLNSSATIRFFPNITIGVMLDLLMVEAWNWSIFHKHYYETCRPYQCVYVVSTNNDAIYIITALIGLIGGLVTALKLIIPRLVFTIDKIMQYRRRIKSIVQPISTIKY